MQFARKIIDLVEISNIIELPDEKKFMTEGKKI